MADNTNRKFGRRLAARRTALGWSQKDLAAKAGVHDSQISRFETGDKGIILETAVHLAAITGISLEGLDGPCPHCGDSPPAGFTCNDCGTKGEDR